MPSFSRVECGEMGWGEWEEMHTLNLQPEVCVIFYKREAAVVSPVARAYNKIVGYFGVVVRVVVGGQQTIFLFNPR